MDNSIEDDIKNGFIASNGKPLKCYKCNGTEFESVNEIYGDGFIEEYSLECKKCKKIVGYWSYGHWKL